MLGEKLGEELGQVTNVRVLPDEGIGSRVEVSFQSSGRLMNFDVSDMGTYIATSRPDGTLFGTGQGILVTPEGETALWRGQGVGRMKGRGSAASYRGAVFFETASPKLKKLNGVCAVFEFEVDESGKAESTSYEWK